MARILKIMAFVLAAAIILPLMPVFYGTAYAESDGMVRVKLTRLGSPESISFTTGCDLYIDADKSAKIPAGAKVTVSVSSDDMLLKTGGVSLNMGDDFTLNRKNAGTAGVKFTSPAMANLYCGDLRFYIESGRISTILTLYVEDYLYGVVGFEMSNSDPIDALKSQAVASRNYVLRNKAARTSKMYDVVDTSSDQVFKGYNFSYKNVIDAVDSTRGMVLTYDGKLAACFYGSSNGGQTESTKNAWGTSLPYSVVKDDRFDLESTGVTKSATIKKDLSNEKINSGLRAAFVSGMKDALEDRGLSTDAEIIDILTVISVEPHTARYPEPSRLYKLLRFTIEASSTDASGERVTGQYTFDVPTYDGVEDWFDLGINSKDTETVWVDEGDSAFTISFRRNGHGVGMSQRGAKVMAKAYDMDYDTILDYYYPGTTLTHLSLSDTTGSKLGDSGDNSILNKPLEPSATPAPTATPTPEATATPAPGPTEQPAMQAYVKLSGRSGSLNVRREPTTASAIVGRLSHGAVVDVYALEGQWVRIGIGERRGYVMKTYLVAIADDNATPAPTSAPTAAPTATPAPTYKIDPDAVYAQVRLSGSSSTLKLREKPSSSSAVVAHLKNRQYLLVTAISGDWAKVETGSGQVGYAAKRYLRRVYPEDVLGTAAPTIAPTAAPTMAPTVVPTVAPTATPAPTYQIDPDAVYAQVRLSGSSSTLKLREKPSTSSAVVTYLRNRQYLLVTALSGDWAKVETASGDTGYVYIKYLRRVYPEDVLGTAAPTSAPTAAPTPGNGIRCVATVSTFVFEKADYSSTALTGLDEGAYVTVTAYSSEWAYVITDNCEGYVPTPHLKAVK